MTAVGGVWLGELGDGPMGVDPDTTGGFANSEAHVQLDHQRIAVEGYLKEAAKTSAKQPKCIPLPPCSSLGSCTVFVTESFCAMHVQGLQFHSASGAGSFGDERCLRDS